MAGKVAVAFYVAPRENKHQNVKGIEPGSSRIEEWEQGPHLSSWDVGLSPASPDCTIWGKWKSLNLLGSRLSLL